MPYMYNPTPEFSRVVKAGHMLRQSTECLPLASGPLPEAVGETTMARIFRSLVNQSVDPRLDRTQGYAPRLRQVSESSCLLAEIDFGQMFLDAQADTLAYNGGRVIMQDDEPILVQKSTGQRTLLSFTDVEVAGITYPAGSLMGVYLRPDYEPSAQRYMPPAVCGRFDSESATDIVGLDFLRPTLLALEPAERKTYLARPEWDHHRRENSQVMAALGSITLEEMRDVVHAQAGTTYAANQNSILIIRPGMVARGLGLLQQQPGSHRLQP